MIANGNLHEPESQIVLPGLKLLSKKGNLRTGDRAPVRSYAKLN